MRANSARNLEGEFQFCKRLPNIRRRNGAEHGTAFIADNISLIPANNAVQAAAAVRIAWPPGISVQGEFRLQHLIYSATPGCSHSGQLSTIGQPATPALRPTCMEIRTDSLRSACLRT